MNHVTTIATAAERLKALSRTVVSGDSRDFVINKELSRLDVEGLCATISTDRVQYTVSKDRTQIRITKL